MRVKSYGDVLWFLANNLLFDIVRNFYEKLQKGYNLSDVCTSRFGGR